MTRAEAIARIKEHTIIHKMNEPRAIFISEALKMAIKALSVEPCEDAISRKAVLELAQTIETDDYSGNEVFDAIDVEDVKKLPPVMPKQKTGYWIETYDDCGYGIYKCSVCHGKYVDPETGKWNEVFDYKYPFCPNCGAKMESEDKE